MQYPVTVCCRNRAIMGRVLRPGLVSKECRHRDVTRFALMLSSELSSTGFVADLDRGSATMRDAQAPGTGASRDPCSPDGREWRPSAGSIVRERDGGRSSVTPLPPGRAATLATGRAYISGDIHGVGEEAEQMYTVRRTGTIDMPVPKEHISTPATAMSARNPRRDHRLARSATSICAVVAVGLEGSMRARDWLGPYFSGQYGGDVQCSLSAAANGHGDDVPAGTGNRGLRQDSLSCALCCAALSLGIIPNNESADSPNRRRRWRG